MVKIRGKIHWQGQRSKYEEIEAMRGKVVHPTNNIHKTIIFGSKILGQGDEGSLSQTLLCHVRASSLS